MSYLSVAWCRAVLVTCFCSLLVLTFFAVSHWSLLRAAGQPLASANENTVFPESVWQTATPEEVGMDSAKVAQALATLPEPAVVIRHGKIIASKGDITRPGYIWSASKSLVALIAARLIQQGYITLDTPVPESNDPDGPLATYRQFLSMTSDYRLPPRSPGDHYAYNNGAVVHYANQIKSQYFPDKSEIDMLKEAYLNTIGFEDSLDYTWYMSGWGGGWSMSTRDIARVAYLVLRDGRWKEQQILPESFVHDLFVNQIPEHATEGTRGDPFYNEYPIGTPNLPGAYSYGFWLTHKRPIFGDAQSQTEAISMWGAFGTTVMISKESDLIIAAVNTSYDHSGGQVSGASLDLFAQAIIQPDIDNSLAVVNAASYSTSIAPETIASAFGTNLADGTYAASLNPLPTSLGGTVLQVNGIDAPLFYVSPTQVNFVIPAETAIGAATIKVLVNGEMRASGTANIEQVAPAIFTAAANGQGPPAGHSTFDGENHDLLTHPDGSPRPLGTGTDETPHYLILYGTGFRKASSLSAVRVIIGRVEAEVTFAGAHSYYIGLDQLNLILPRSLKTAGEVSLIVIVDSKQANEVLIHVL